MLIVGIIGLAYVGLALVIAVALWGANWYRRRGVELREGEWLPWHPWLRHHPGLQAWTFAVLYGSTWAVWDGVRGRSRASDFLWIAAESAILGLLAYFFGRRALKARP